MKNNNEFLDSSVKAETGEYAKVNDYLAKKYGLLVNDYRDGQYSEHCGLIAMDIARLLLEEGGKPSLYVISGKKIDSVRNTKTLVPKRYEGRVTWGGHTVCESSGLVYDPLHKTPVAFNEYLQTTFTEPVEAKVFVQNDRIQEFLNRK